MCPFKDKKKISLWPVILIIMNLPEAMRYDPRNIIIIYIAASAAGGQPKNFHTHLSMVVDELIDSAAGHDLLVGGVKTRVHVMVPVLSADGRGPLMLCTIKLDVRVLSICVNTPSTSQAEKSY